jgi:hypothetical protein
MIEDEFGKDEARRRKRGLEDIPGNGDVPVNGDVPGNGAFRGTRASANTSGPDFSPGFGPVKLRTGRSAPNEENLFLLPDRF